MGFIIMDYLKHLSICLSIHPSIHPSCLYVCMFLDCSRKPSTPEYLEEIHAYIRGCKYGNDPIKVCTSPVEVIESEINFGLVSVRMIIWLSVDLLELRTMCSDPKLICKENSLVLCTCIVHNILLILFSEKNSGWT